MNQTHLVYLNKEFHIKLHQLLKQTRIFKNLNFPAQFKASLVSGLRNTNVPEVMDQL